jgi:hypothetical protein
MPKQLNNKAFIRRSRQIHGKKYDYCRVDYQGIYHKVSIHCPMHGWFQQAPQSHFSGCGCPKCGLEKTRKVIRAVTITKKQHAADSFVSKAQSKHGNYYSYERVNYRGANAPVEIICPVHGAFFQQPIVHTTGHGCRKCGDVKTRQAKLKKDDSVTIKRILNEATKKLGGRFPTHKDVVQHGWWEIDRVTKKLGGYRAARLQFGFQELEKKKGYWRDWNNITMYLQKHFPALLKSGQCPTVEMMKATGEYPSFVYCNGGLPEICKRLKLVPAIGFQARDGHFVRSFFELLLDEYLYSRQIDHTPEVKPFKDHNFRCDQKVGNYYIELWGYGYKDFGNYKKRRKQKERLYRRHGLTLIALEVSFFRASVKKIERQFDDLFAPLGFSVVKKKPFSMRSITQVVSYPWNEETVKAHIQNYISRYGEFPAQKKLGAAGMSGLAARIQQFGGFPYFRSLMGFSPWQPKRKWNDATITTRLRAICERLGRFPKDVELSSDLRNAIRKNSTDGPHDLNYYRTKLGYPITKKSIGYWTEDTIQNELKEILSTNGVFPTNSFLLKNHRSGLSVAIQQSGGFNAWRQKLGYPIIQHSPNQYTDESLEEWLRKVTLEKGRVPTQKELRQLDSRKQSVVNCRGGVTRYLTLLAEKDPNMRGYLQSYRLRIGASQTTIHSIGLKL